MGNCLSSRKGASGGQNANNNAPPNDQQNANANANADAANNQQPTATANDHALSNLNAQDSRPSIPNAEAPRPPPRAAVAGPSRYRHLPLNQRPDEPLRRHEWTHDVNNKGRPPTHHKLEQMREEFWYTRVTGREEVWRTVKTVVEILQEDDSDDALLTAREILHAAEITVPSGDLVNAAYDIFGNKYKFPNYVLSNPTNMSLTPPDSPSKESLHSSGSSYKSTDTSKNARRESKGKEVDVSETTTEVIVRDPRTAPLTAIFRMSMNGKDHAIRFWPDENVRDIAERLIASADIDRRTHRLKLILGGHELKDDQTLVNQRWEPKKITTAIMQDLSIVAPWLLKQPSILAQACAEAEKYRPLEPPIPVGPPILPPPALLSPVGVPRYTEVENRVNRSQNDSPRPSTRGKQDEE
ncbi:hypothetical protein TWF696_008110 [Orbilia brochopaga]|uniref:DC-UbP/UBTD2 N-terminal domain-containing protein n=1 Tax=Orbilia brochopaga TaxID=3140254 RepID=A0AAV9UQU7_9PEZI